MRFQVTLTNPLTGHQERIIIQAKNLADGKSQAMNISHEGRYVELSTYYQNSETINKTFFLGK